jgi:leucyl aminopeptidase (aminopeptidase T)
MNEKEKRKMFLDVFAPKKGEKILFLYDIPHDNIKDNKSWEDRREMTREWYKIFCNIGSETGFITDILSYPATGVQNSKIPKEIIERIRKTNLVIAMTEYSASSSLVPICKEKNSITRCASMPTVERRMEKTAFKADYKKVQKYAKAIEEMLNKSSSAEITFSTGDTLIIDLRNRKPHSEGGSCKKKGDFINFPSGEACKAPYEATPDEIKEFGESKTRGTLPVDYDGELVRYEIEKNKIRRILGEGQRAEEMRTFFSEKKSRRNISELGIGCNPNAIVTGNVLEDEKVAGLHIAYGMSTHLGGKIKSDTHMDICYPKKAPVEAKKLTLVYKNSQKVNLIQNAELQYSLLE